MARRGCFEAKQPCVRAAAIVSPGHRFKDLARDEDHADRRTVPRTFQENARRRPVVQQIHDALDRLGERFGCSVKSGDSVESRPQLQPPRTAAAAMVATIYRA